MSASVKSRFLRGILILAIIAAAIYGCGRLLTSGVTNLAGVDYHAGKIQTSNNFSFSHSHSSSGSSIFQARRIAISWVDDHPVLEQVVTRMRDDLLALGFVDQVDVFDPDDTHEPGGLLYDAYLTLSIDVVQDDKLFVKRDFKATVHIAAGMMPFNSRSTYTDHLSSPGINYALNGELDHTSQSTQVGTPYKMIADNIGDELAGKIADQFTEWYEEFGADVDWPDDLIGVYPDDLTIPWPPGIDKQVVVDGYGLMQHRHALWSVKTGNPESFVQKFHQAYIDAGWRIDQGAVIGPTEHHERYHFRAWDGSPHQVEVFEVRDGYAEREPGEVSRICVRYQHRFDRDETRNVINRLLSEGIQHEVLGYLVRQMDATQKNHYYSILADTHPTDPRSLTALARHVHKNGQAEKAHEYLVHALMQAKRLYPDGEVVKKIQAAATELGLGQIEEPPLTVESLEAHGYQSLQELIGARIVLKKQELLRFYFEAEGGLKSVDLWIAPVPADPDLMQIRDYSRRPDGGWGSLSGGGRHDEGGLYEAAQPYKTKDGLVYVRIKQRLADELFDVDVFLENKP